MLGHQDQFHERARESSPSGSAPTSKRCASASASDPRIGYHFIYPGLGYGGSCFPKDVQALARSARGVGYTPALLDSVEAVNKRQKRCCSTRSRGTTAAILKGKTIAIWGLAFKPGTDDMREAPSRVLLEQLWAAGAKVRAFDPGRHEGDAPHLRRASDLTLCNARARTLEGADALAIVTEWKEFRSPDFDNLKKQLKAPVIFDGRNLYDPSMMQKQGHSRTTPSGAARAGRLTSPLRCAAGCVAAGRGRGGARGVSA
jgi:UDPglucose 6-dehydrogenase